MQKPFSIRVRNLSHKHMGESRYLLKNLDFEVSSSEKVCIAGVAGSGKSTFTHILKGLLPNFEGSVSINGYSLRDLDLTFYRDHLGGNGTAEDIFDGTWLENITVGNPSANMATVMKAIRQVGLEDEVGLLPQGLETKILSSGKGLSTTTVHKILLARCLAKETRLLILHDHFSFFSRKEKSAMVGELIRDPNKTMIIISNDPMVMAACNRVALMHDGQLKATGDYRDLLTKGVLQDCIDPS